ncbi:hypothetical protein OC846_002684 [Tilletia horrida]|uniref:Uncharacterized protein n=1 Tax=Tilletia horrida TaxID=155126 RepID=A0AAN6JSE3_9BASI|nr:hypothetical protein OC846_002684 [Tilletia horrida]
MTMEDEQVADAAPTRPATPANGTKRKEPEGTPRKDRDETARRQALLEAQEMPPPSAPASTRRRSMRIEQGGIAPASGRQQVVSGVGRTSQDGEFITSSQTQVTETSPCPANAPIASGEVPLPTPANTESGRSGPANNIVVLQRRIKAGLAQRRRKEEAVADFFESLTSGLQQIDGVNALDSVQVHTIGILLTAATKVAFAAPGQTVFPPSILQSIKLWDPSKAPSPPETSIPSAQEPQTPRGTGTAASSWAAKAAAPAQSPTKKSGLPPLAPYAGYRTQGGTKGDAAKFASSGGSKDERTFIRVPTTSTWAKEDPFEVRLQLEALLAKSCAPTSLSIGRVKSVQSGFSFTPGELCSAQDFQPYHLAIQKHFEANVVEGPSAHQRFVLRGIPAKLVSGGIAKTVTPALVQQQLAKACPSAVLALPPRIITPERTGSTTPLWLLTISSGSFETRSRSPYPGSIALFDRDCSLRPYRSNNASRHCGRCLSWHHSTTKCRALASVCAHCGLNGHSAAEHTCAHCTAEQPQSCVPECFHCKGPATTGHPGCRARPIWDSRVNAVIVPEGERLLRLQNRGRAERKLQIGKVRAAKVVTLAARSPEQAPSGPTSTINSVPTSSSTTTTPTSSASGPRSNALGAN